MNGEQLLRDLLHGLTRTQRQQLRDLGIPHSRLSEWTHGKAYPTPVQTAILAAVTGTEYGQLQRAVTWGKAKPEERARIARAASLRPRQR